MNSRPAFHRRALAAILIIVSSSIVSLCGVASGSTSLTLNGLTYEISVQLPLTASVTNQIANATTVIIPSTITADGNTYSVTSIGGSAFLGDAGITSVTIPNSVTSIGDRAFSNCYSLQSVTLPINPSFTSIGHSVFALDYALTSITIPNSVLTIGSTAFAFDGALTSMVIPNSVTLIDEGAFADDTALTSVTIGSSVATIGRTAFYRDTALTSIIIPNSVTSLGDSAFSGDTALASVTIGNKVSTIGSWAFYRDTALTSIIIPNSVTAIGLGAFNGDVALTSVTIGSSVATIDEGTFSGDIALTSVNIPNSVTSILDYAFYDAALTSIIIPNSVTLIGASAFSGDTALSFINPSGFVATWTGAGGPYTTAQLRTATDIGAVTGTWAIVVHVTPIVYSKPTAPTNVVATMNNGSATISFTAGSSGNLPTYDEIDMFINGLSVGNVCNVTGASTCPISNLGPDVSFTFSVTAINSKGSAVSTVSNPVSYSSPVFVSATTTPPPTTTTTAPPVKRTIACVRGATSKKITAVSPVCPAGYKKK